MKKFASNSPKSKKDCEKEDKEDDLRNWRSKFQIPKGLIYLDGNSLGPMPKKAYSEMKKATRNEWAEELTRSWIKAGWWELPETLGELIAPVVGATSGQIIVSDTTSLNLFKSINAALSIRPTRSVIIAEADSFPTDLYVLEGITSSNKKIRRRLLGIDGESLEELLDDQVAAVIFSHVNYRTGELLPIEKLVEKTHKAGAVFILDVCHSAGVLPVKLDLWDVDFAVGCTYKYLNGGPGSPAFLYVSKKNQKNAVNPIPGWWGHARPFAFEKYFQASKGIQGFLTSTQPILSLRGLQAGLEIAKSVDIRLVRKKSQRLTQLFIFLVKRLCKKYNITIITPNNPEKRGSQVALYFENGFSVIQALINRKIIADYRNPGIMRFGFAPLYLSFKDVWDTVQALNEILKTEEWRSEIFSRKHEVT